MVRQAIRRRVGPDAKGIRSQHAHELEAQRAGEAEQQRAREATEAAAVTAAKHRSDEEAAQLASPAISLTDRVLSVQSGRMALVRLECLGKNACHGKLTITARSRTTSRSPHRALPLPGKATIATAAFSIGGDEAKTARIDLNATGRALLSADHGRLSSILELLELAPGPRNTQTMAVHLIQERPHGNAR